MKQSTFAFTLFAAVLAVPAAGRAGVIDSPAPTLGGLSSHVVFIVSGVTKNNGVETEFVCTSLEPTVNIRLGVEVFDPAGGPPLNNVSAALPGNGEEIVPPGGTVTFGTDNVAGFHEDEIIAGMPLNIKGGSARIVSTSKKITCGAYMMDEVASPPASMAPLRVVYRKQQGD